MSKKKKNGNQGTTPAIKRIHSRSEKQKSQLIDELHELDNSCVTLLKEPAKLSPYLVNEDLLKYTDFEQVENYSKILSRDVHDFKQRLDIIRLALPTKLNDDDADDILQALQIGEKYNEWWDKYSQVVLPTVEKLSDLIYKAYENYHKQNNVTEDQQQTNQEDVSQEGITNE